MEKRGLKGQFDRISTPGVSTDFDTVDKFAKISLRLHNPDEVFIYEHEDCGAYGKDDSEEAHRVNAQRLADSLKTIKPQLKINTLIVTSKGISEL